ncbi:MAG TPA: aminotransferase class III-fold pyridoxal phosphate-dependent enzyme [Chloroflexota bacterium]|nr:aminotransferase class III-fold pyridoxal phosphate-dependent enzyme [Chloroflexota bacterium]
MAQVRPGTLAERWTERRSKSAALAQRAEKVFPSGVTHDSRYMEPFAIYVTHAQGSRKWDVDGNEYVDYWSGHGALLLGHNYPSVCEATVEQAKKGTHFGACHELEVEWGELVQQIVPSAQKVKFFSSGTEATLMAMRLARAFTGKDKVLKIQGHFHGWHDYATIAMAPPYDEPVSRGIPRAIKETMVAVPFQDVAALRAALDADPDIAGLIMLAGGAGTDYLRQVREITRERGVILIFDEVVTGFRYAPGGCQEFYGVTPDMTTMAKILAGGLPGGAIGGRADLLSLLEFRDDPQWMRFGRINHPGTFNANPLSAAAGVACLKVVRDGAIQKQATETADKLRAGFNAVLQRRGVNGEAGGDVSLLAISLPDAKLKGRSFAHRMRMAMQVGGVDYNGNSMIVSAIHSDADVARTVEAFDQAIGLLQQDGAI